jgi:hypothetical protein
MVTEWNWTERKPHLGNSSYFENLYIKKSGRFEHLQALPVEKITEKQVIKHVYTTFQSKLVF